MAVYLDSLFHRGISTPLTLKVDNFIPLAGMSCFVGSLVTVLILCDAIAISM